MSRLSLLALLALGLSLGTACSKEEPKPEEKSADEKADKKSAKDDESDDDSKAKKKKKKADDEPKKDEDEPKSEGGRDAKEGVVPEGTPVPPGCAPDPSGLLGQKPKLVSSAGQPGASLAIWQRGDGDKKQAAITISADGKCYVDYLELKPAAGAEALGYSFDKGAIQAVTGTTEKSNATIVGFKVTYTEGVAMGHRMLDTYGRFYGYVHANGTPYSCAKLAGEKGDRCAMYQKPLVVQTAAACSDAKGGGPPALGAPSAITSTIKLPTGLKVPPAVTAAPSATTATPTTTPSATPSGVPSTSPSAVPSATPDAGAADSGVACDGKPTCSTIAGLSKDKDHVYVRASAGKPSACPTGQVKIGDTWYFDENTWKKR